MHGRGCFFSDGKDEIDWDFGDNRICGINCGLLKSYIDFYYPQLTNEFTYIKIKEEFEKAFVNGVATRRYDLYYLAWDKFAFMAVVLSTGKLITTFSSAQYDAAMQEIVKRLFGG